MKLCRSSSSDIQSDLLNEYVCNELQTHFRQLSYAKELVLSAETMPRVLHYRLVHLMYCDMLYFVRNPTASTQLLYGLCGGIHSLYS